MPSAVCREEGPRPIAGINSAARAATDDPKRSFLRVVSHELRTPLNSILGFSEILASELYGPLGVAQYREYAEIIRCSGEKLLRIVNQVVEIARLHSGDIDISLQPERLAPLFETLRDGLHESQTARELRLEIAPCGDIEAVTDARALRSVLAHLMQNAVTFSPEGGLIEVRVDVRRDGRAIIVRNEGEGVDAADLERLMLPFEQGGNALTRRAEGAGLGLAICDLACKAMGARLTLVSDHGQGFAAYILLPAP